MSLGKDSGSEGVSIPPTTIPYDSVHTSSLEDVVERGDGWPERLCWEIDGARDCAALEDGQTDTDCLEGTHGLWTQCACLVIISP